MHPQSSLQRLLARSLIGLVIVSSGTQPWHCCRRWTCSPRRALGGKDSADLALAGVGRIAVVRLY
jgi:hypothetical protein